jgi:hypothetical protein
LPANSQLPDQINFDEMFRTALATIFPVAKADEGTKPQMPSALIASMKAAGGAEAPGKIKLYSAVSASCSGC